MEDDIPKVFKDRKDFLDYKDYFFFSRERLNFGSKVLWLLFSKKILEVDIEKTNNDLYENLLSYKNIIHYLNSEILKTLLPDDEFYKFLKRSKYDNFNFTRNEMDEILKTIADTQTSFVYNGKEYLLDCKIVNPRFDDDIDSNMRYDYIIYKLKVKS